MRAGSSLERAGSGTSPTPGRRPPLLFNAGKINFIVAKSLDNFFSEVGCFFDYTDCYLQQKCLKSPWAGLDGTAIKMPAPCLHLSFFSCHSGDEHHVRFLLRWKHLFLSSLFAHSLSPPVYGQKRRFKVFQVQLWHLPEGLHISHQHFGSLRHLCNTFCIFAHLRAFRPRLCSEEP